MMQDIRVDVPLIGQNSSSIPILLKFFHHSTDKIVFCNAFGEKCLQKKCILWLELYCVFGFKVVCKCSWADSTWSCDNFSPLYFKFISIFKNGNHTKKKKKIIKEMQILQKKKMEKGQILSNNCKKMSMLSENCKKNMSFVKQSQKIQNS